MLVVTLALYAEGKTDGSMDEDFDFLPLQYPH